MGTRNSVKIGGNEIVLRNPLLFFRKLSYSFLFYSALGRELIYFSILRYFIVVGFMLARFLCGENEKGTSPVIDQVVKALKRMA